MSDRDYTEGESIPVEDLVLGGSSVEQSAAEAEASNVAGDLPLGPHLLKVAGFSAKGAEKKYKETHFNGQKVGYETLQLTVKLTDSNNLGAMYLTLLLPPDVLPSNPPEAMAYYAHGTKADGKSDSFMASVFYQFIGRLFPNVVKGEPLPPAARGLKNWLNRQAWAVVEMDKGGWVKPGRDPKTGLPYEPTEPRARLKPFSFRDYVPGQPSPYAGLAAPAPSKPAPKSAPKPAMAGAGASANGYHGAADDDDNGLGDI